MNAKGSLRSGRLLWPLLVLWALGATTALAQPAESEIVPTMSMDVTRAEIRTVLRAIADFSGKSIVADHNVEGVLTVRALDLSWREMLETVCRSASLVPMYSGSVIRVATAKTAHEEELERESAARKAEEYMPLATRVVPVNYANASELIEVLTTVATSRGQVQADSRTNSLVLTDIAPRLELLTEMAQRLDNETVQVEITAKIVDVDVMEARQLGISWSGTNLHSFDVDASGTASLNPADMVDPTTDIRVGVIRSFGDVQAKLQALESDNKADIISTPTITTVNNHTARILVGKEVPLITLDEAGNAITELKKVGITLEVTPYINSEENITMDLHPEISDLASQATVTGGIVFNTTEADTRAMVRAGETAVIGGLIRSSEIEFERGVPLLRKIPLLGALFRSTDVRTEKRELLIFVTPRIVQGAVDAASGEDASKAERETAGGS